MFAADIQQLVKEFKFGCVFFGCYEQTNLDFFAKIKAIEKALEAKQELQAQKIFEELKTWLANEMPLDQTMSPKKLWRKRNRKLCRESKKRYYAKSSENCNNEGKEWEDFAIELIVSEDRFPDSFISPLIGRSVRSIQQKIHHLLHPRSKKPQTESSD